MITVGVEYDATEIQRMREEVQQEMDTIIHDVADQILAESQILVPVDKSTLKKSGNVVHGRGYSMIGYNTPYAKPVHDGFETHIQNVNPHLRNMDGVVVRVREHERLMPGRTGRPYLDDAIKKVLDTLPESTRNFIEVVRVERG